MGPRPREALAGGGSAPTRHRIGRRIHPHHIDANEGAAAPETPEELELAQDIAPAYGEALQAAMPSLVAQLEAEYAARMAERGPEPGPGPAGTAMAPDPPSN